LLTGIDATTVGCLNDQCCEATLYFVKAKYDYLVYFAILSTFIGFANYVTLVALITFLSNYSLRRLTHDVQEKIMGYLMIGAVVCLILYVSTSVP
jgi:hypothetical protein